jgi:hypothetical protein
MFHLTIVGANIKEGCATEVVWDDDETTVESFQGVRSHVFGDMCGDPTICCGGTREHSISFGGVPEIQLHE